MFSLPLFLLLMKYYAVLLLEAVIIRKKHLRLYSFMLY